MKKIKGVYSVLITPFDSHNKLDELGFRENIRFQLTCGVDGIVALGTTGEAPTLSEKEKTRVIEIAVEEAGGKLPVMIGTGSYSTQQTIEYTQEAKELGADCALIVTPYYNKPTQEGLYRHFHAVAEAVDIPILLYNIQGRTGQNLETKTLKRLVEIPRIVGVKEASGSIPQITEVIEMVRISRPDFSVMSGDDALTFAVMALGGNGILSVVSNLIPMQIVSLVKALQNQDYDLARQIHYQLMPLFRGAFIETNPIPIKAMMQMSGMAAGQCRLPLCELQASNVMQLEKLLEKFQETETVALK